MPAPVISKTNRYTLTCLATCIAVNVLRSMEEELSPLDVRRLEGEEGVASTRRGPGDSKGVKGRGWTGVVGVLDDGEWDSDDGYTY